MAPFNQICPGGSSGGRARAVKVDCLKMQSEVAGSSPVRLCQNSSGTIISYPRVRAIDRSGV